MTYDVFGVGNAIVDIQLQVDDAFLHHIDVAKGLMTLVEAEQQVKVLAALAGRATNRCSGGSACNTIVGVADLGGKAAYAGKTADDDLGSFYVDDLRRVGVAVPVAAGTGRHDGHLGHPDHAGRPAHDAHASRHLDDAVARRHAGSRDREGASTSTSKATSSPATRRAPPRCAPSTSPRSTSVKVALTISDPFVVSLQRDLFWELIKGPVDLLFANLEEARSLTGQHDPIEAARADPRACDQRRADARRRGLAADARRTALSRSRAWE